MGRSRRALSNLGGSVRVRGAEAESHALREAWQAASKPADVLTHGFHAYPARMHAQTARALLHAFAPAGGRVLDPFCGSGTVLVEALVGGWRATGVDLNPLAMRVAEVKCLRTTAADRQRFERTLEAVADASLQRVAARVKSKAPLSDGQRRAYEPHVLLELAGLREEIGTVAHEADRRALEVVLSAIVIKFSRQRADTDQTETPKRIGKSVPTRFFQRKGSELVRRWAQLEEACSATPRVFEVRLREGDARGLTDVVGTRNRFDLIVSSPPYGGTYDYAEQHAMRLAWLGLAGKQFRAKEIGARRNLSGDAGGPRRWEEELTEALQAMRAVVRDDGRCVLVIGDAQVGGRRVAADEQLESLATSTGWCFRAAASQGRPDRLGGPARQEHLVLLESSE